MGDITPQFIRTATLRLNPADDVVIATRELPAGTLITGEAITTADKIPSGHKVATRAIALGQPVRRYNQIIGFASRDIGPGEHVHLNNLAMGAFAVKALLRSDQPVGRLRGQVHRYHGVPLVVTYHPAYLLRSPREKAKSWDDLKKVWRFLQEKGT